MSQYVTLNSNIFFCLARALYRLILGTKKNKYAYSSFDIGIWYAKLEILIELSPKTVSNSQGNRKTTILLLHIFSFRGLETINWKSKQLEIGISPLKVVGINTIFAQLLVISCRLYSKPLKNTIFLFCLEFSENARLKFLVIVHF